MDVDRNFRRSESTFVHARPSRPRAISRLLPAAPLSPVAARSCADAPTGRDEHRARARHACVGEHGADGRGRHKRSPQARAQARSRRRAAAERCASCSTRSSPTSRRRMRSHRSQDTLQLGPLSRPLEAILTDAYVLGIIDLHVHPPALTIQAPDRPVASPLARLQARTRDDVTTLLHTRVRIADANALRLLPLVDGTRDRAALAAAVKQIALDIDPSRAHGLRRLRAREVRATWVADGREERGRAQYASAADAGIDRVAGSDEVLSGRLDFVKASKCVALNGRGQSAPSVSPRFRCEGTQATIPS